MLCLDLGAALDSSFGAAQIGSKMKIVAMMVVMVVACLAAGSPKTSPPKAATAPAAPPPVWMLAEGAPPELQRVIDDQPNLIYAEIFPIRVNLNHLEARLGEIKGHDKKAKAERDSIQLSINALRDDIKAIESDDSLRLKTATPREPNEYGRLYTVRVIQVIDEQTAVVEVIFYLKETPYDQHPEIAYDRCFYAWLSGIDTSGWTDNKTMDLSIYVFSPGTHKSGSRTMIELRQFTLDAFIRVPAD